MVDGIYCLEETKLVANVDNLGRKFGAAGGMITCLVASAEEEELWHIGIKEGGKEK